jgi:hypothetical protein
MCNGAMLQSVSHDERYMWGGIAFERFALGYKSMCLFGSAWLDHWPMQRSSQVVGE